MGVLFFAPPRRRAITVPGAALALLLAVAGAARGDPPLPTFGPAVYNIAVSNASINGGAAASTGAADNAAAINAYVTYCSTHGGGTVEVPAGTFLSGTITLKSNVNLQVDAGATLRDTSIANTLLKCTSGTNMAITGTGTIDGAATTTVGSANLVDLRGVNTLLISGVSILNAGHEHLVPINDSNVTIQNIRIADPGTLAANGGKYLANTDAIDYAGNNFLIKNCNITCGDDDIVAKPASYAVTNVMITNCTIGSGHGISVGGGSAKGVDNIIVTNCTFTGTDNGLRVKASDTTSGNAGGGSAHPVINLTFSNITMTNVANPIIIDSFYDNGSNNFPSGPTDTTHYPAAPTTPGANTPFWENITFDNITAAGSSNAGLIYGLNTSPANTAGISFNNVKITANSHMNLWYATGVNISGLTITVPGGDAYANASPVHGAFISNSTLVATTSVVWTGAADASTWSSRVSNWKLSGSNTASLFADPANTTFDDSAPANARAVALNIGVSPTTVIINTTASTYAVSGIGMITGPGSVTKNGTGSFMFNVPLTYTGSTTVNAGTVVFAAADNAVSGISGAGGLTVAAGANLTSDGIQLNTLTLNGTAAIRTNGASGSKLNTLAIAGTPGNWTGRIDITNNVLVVQPAAANKSAALATLISELLSGQNAKLTGSNPTLWGGNGITSSTVAGDPTHMGVGLYDNAILGKSTFGGVTGLDANSLMVIFALLGDTNLDGHVNATDLQNISARWHQTGGTWDGGDLNLDGVVDSLDVEMVVNHWDSGTAFPVVVSYTPGFSYTLVSVPESAALGVLGPGVLILMRRRRRRG